MTIGAMVFMALSWACVLGLTTWAFWRILGQTRHADQQHVSLHKKGKPS